MKSHGIYLVTKASVHSFEGGGGYPASKTFYATLLGRDLHRLELVISQEQWPAFFEAALRKFTIGRTIVCDFLYYATGSNSLELRLAAWRMIIGVPLVEASTMHPITEADFFDNKKITSFVWSGPRYTAYPEPIPLNGQVEIRYFGDQSQACNFPLIERGGRAPGFLKWVLYPEDKRESTVSPADNGWLTRLMRWLSLP